MKTANGAADRSNSPARWLFLVHQLPPRSAYSRVKIWRRLRDVGAVALKNSLYTLPQNERTTTEFLRLLREIEQDGGTGILCEAEFVAGLRDDQVRDVFNSARDADYQALAKDLRQRTSRQRKKRDSELKLELEKARRQLARIAKIDFFGAAGRLTVEALLSRLEHSPIVNTETRADETADISSLAGKIWVTRRGVHIDRIACAWLIRRFIDSKGKFKFVANNAYRPAAGEFGFDMVNGQFTHEGAACSFEVLLKRMGSLDGALAALGEIIHDLDFKDRKFDRPETSGIGHIIEGICATQAGDLDRIARGSAILDDAYERFRRNVIG